MSIWSRIGAAVAALRQGEGLASVFDQLRAAPDRTVAFTIAVIALGAKMAKADGVVTRAEVSAFREIFHIPPSDEASAARVFNLARQDVAGFEDYAARIGRLFARNENRLCDIIEGLFYIAMADGAYHADEDAFLARVAEIFGFDKSRFRQIRARFVPDAERDPYEVLGIAHDASMDAVRAAWRAAVKESHPDMLVSRGLPEEALRLAERRMADINRAWEEISEARG